MGKRNRTLSVILAVLMVLTAFPLSVLPVPEARAANGESLEIDYDNTQGNSLADAMKEEARYAVVSAAPDLAGQIDYYKNAHATFHWVQTSSVNITNDGKVGLRKYLSENVTDYRYVSLSGDIDFHTTKQDEWEPIVISTDKVLDLNGYEITIRYDANAHKGQSTFPEMHRAHLFEIVNGATLTIIDSSRWRIKKTGGYGDEGGTGYISMTARMIYPFSNDIRYYTTRDLFWVLDGTLVTYGGTFQAGRQKDQRKSNFSWSRLRQCIGTAVELGVNVASYATGIDAAVSAKNDLAAGFASQKIVDNPEDDGLDDTLPSTIKRTGADAPEEALAESPDGKDSRDKSVKEKGSSNTANASGSAKKENTEMAAARKNITNSVMNQSGIGKIVDGIFSLGSQIAGMTGKDESSRVTEAIFGTPVHLGTDGTFVCYGGTFRGYGSSPNVRDAVVEVTLKPDTVNPKTKKLMGGQAYIYGGSFEGCAGANIFNFVESYTGDQRVQQVVGHGPNDKFNNVVAMKSSETNELRILFDGPDGNPVSTRNVVVRGGTFRNYYELRMLSLKADGDSEHFTKFPGTPGGLGLGVDSFGEDMIKDGRIQIVDKYGDGNLVLMDEVKSPDEKVYHHRLYCSDLELRYKRYIEVIPNPRATNTTHTFHLESVTSDDPTKDLSTGWTNEDGNDRSGPFNQTETVFSYPLDSVATPTYYVVPHLDAEDSSGAGIENSNIWYYMDPVDTHGAAIPIYRNQAAVLRGRVLGTNENVVLNQEYTRDSYAEQKIANLDPGTVSVWALSYRYLSNIKWFTYRVYRVDPLTRRNISESSIYGVDKPLCEMVYGVSSDTLKCKITLQRLEEYMKRTVSGFTGFKKGEMYRIELTMDEHMSFDMMHNNNLYGYSYYPSYATNLPVATATSSILFKCYSVGELKDLGGKVKDVDYTALQWETEPKAGQYASVKIVNGLAGKTDYLARKIFDVYYQWYAIDKNGKETLIAGTDNIYYNNDAGKARHTYEFWNIGSDGHKYVNTVDPNDPKASTYTWNGLPDPKTAKETWSDGLIHAYTHQMTTKSGVLSIDPSKEASPNNNRATATNSDSCYIPKSLAGQKIYCKVVVVNVLWQKEFDHVQTFCSHPVQLEGQPPADPVSSTLAYSKKSGSNYVSAADPCTLRYATLKGLAEGETVTSVTYLAGGREKTFKNLKATQANQIPTAKYPQDFYPAGYDFTKLPAGEVTVRGFLTLSSGRGPTPRGKDKGFLTDKDAKIHFDIKASSMYFSSAAKSGEITVDVSLKDDPVAMRKALRAFFKPSNATYGNNHFTIDETFNTDDYEIASLDSGGFLKLGGKPGVTTIRLDSPDGTNPTVRVTVTKQIEKVEVTGLSAPEVGQKFDQEVSVPEGCGYRVTDVSWYDVTERRTLAWDAKAQDYHYYTAMVTLEPEGVYRVPENVSSALTTETADGLLTVGTGQKDYAFTCDTDEDGSVFAMMMEYTFRKVSGGMMGTTISRVFIDYPTEVKEGSYVEDWLEKVEIVSDVEGYDLNASIWPFCSKRFAETAEALGYPTKDPRNIHRFVEGIQNGVVAEITLPTGVTFSSSLKVYVNGRVQENVHHDSTSFQFSAPDSLRILEGQPAPANTLDVRMKDFDLTIEEGSGHTAVFLNSLRAGKDASRIAMRAEEPDKPYYVSMMKSTDVYGRDTYQFNAEDWTPGRVKLPIFADVDVDGDRRPDITLDWTVYKPVYKTAAEMPAIIETPDRTVTLRILNPDGTLFTTQRMTLGRERFADKATLPDNSLIKAVLTPDNKVCEIGLMGYVTPPAGDTSVTWTVQTAEASVIAHPGASTVTVTSPLPAMQYSADGEHWTTDNAVPGFVRDESTFLYYRQFTDGRIYATSVHTAASGYGVWVGDVEVTDENKDLLDLNHWSYDPAKRELTLYNLDLFDRGVLTPESLHAVIYAKNDLTLNLVGVNSIDSPDAKSTAVYCDGELTLTGAGRLAVNNVTVGLHARDYLTLDASGPYVFTNTQQAFDVDDYDNGCVDYRSGNLTFTPYSRTFSGHTQLWGRLNDDELGTVFDDCYHKDHLMVWVDGDLKENAAGIAAYSSAMSEHGRKIEVVIQHYGTREWPQTRETFDYTSDDSVDCTHGAAYNCICTVCGKVDAGGRQWIAERDHDLVTVPAKAPTCTAGGWAEYQYCKRCPYSTMKALPAAGHKWKETGETEPTCEKAGMPAHSECTVCGASTIDTAYESTGSELAWEPEPHDIVYRKGTAATCAAPGSAPYYECTSCRKRFEDAEGKSPATEAELVIPSVGHEWNEWVVTKEATCTAKGENKRICLLCKQTETESFAALGHDWGAWKVVKAPTAQETGLEERVCARCSAKESRVLEKVGIDYTPGDVDADGSITAADARLALRRAVELENYAPGTREFLACDVDVDDNVTAADARLILRAAVELEDPKTWKKR